MDLQAIAGKRGTDERDATERQISFMKSLGVGDEALLAALGVGQASKILDKLLEGMEGRNH